MAGVRPLDLPTMEGTPETLRRPVPRRGLTMSPRVRVALQRRSRNGALVVLQVYVISLLALPSNATFRVIGASGFPAGLVGMAAAGLYMCWVAFGLHEPRKERYPTKVAFLAVWLTSLASYVALQFRARTGVEASGGDRWLLFLLGITGAALLAAEGLRTLDDFFRVVRPLLWAGAFCGVVAALQYKAHFDLAALIGKHLPLFSYNSSLAGIQQRDGINRVPGTALHPIELGAVSAMLLPLAIAMVMVDRDRPLWKRLLPLMLILVGVPLSVSRTGFVALAVAMLFFIPQLRVRRRLGLLAVLPFGLFLAFVAVPKIITTITSFFTGASTDPSVLSRTEDYSMVAGLVSQRPILGFGGGTYMPDNLQDVLDNAYLKWVIEFGYVGLAVLIVFYMLLPVATAITLRRRTAVEEYAVLAAAIGSGLAGAAVAAATFDAFSFPTQASAQGLLIGLLGALWQIAFRHDPRVAPNAVALNPPQGRSPSMDTLNIWRALKRNRWPVLAAVLLTLLAGFVVHATHPPRYQVSSTVVLIPPPSGPSDTQLKMHPEWRKLDPDNPYTREYDPGTVLTMLSIPITSDAGRADVKAAGGSTDYTIDQIYSFGQSTPFSKVTATANTPAGALRTNNLVVESLQNLLRNMQSKDGTSSRYWVTAQVAAGAGANPPKQVGVITPLAAVGVAGALLIYVAVGVGDAVRLARRRRRSPKWGSATPDPKTVRSAALR